MPPQTALPFLNKPLPCNHRRAHVRAEKRTTPGATVDARCDTCRQSWIGTVELGAKGDYLRIRWEAK